MEQITITITVNPENFIVVDNDYSGHKTGHCVLCEARGWINGLGFPYNPSIVTASCHLQHKEKCPLNQFLDDNGNLVSEIEPEYREIYESTFEFLKKHGYSDSRAKIWALEHVKNLKKDITTK